MVRTPKRQMIRVFTDSGLQRLSEDERELHLTYLVSRDSARAPPRRGLFLRQSSHIGCPAKAVIKFIPFDASPDRRSGHVRYNSAFLFFLSFSLNYYCGSHILLFVTELVAHPA